MILFSPAKINIGLQIIQRRQDGFHNLRSVMYPVALFDIIELRHSTSPVQNFRFTQSGIQVNVSDDLNLCTRAWEIFRREIALPPVELHLHKQIPAGAGLGGGSSNATNTLIGLNNLAGNILPGEQLADMAVHLGSDCPFFLYDQPMLMEGRGEILNTISIALDQYYLVILFPDIHVPTAEAFKGVQPAIPVADLEDLIRKPVGKWEKLIVNDFELSVFANYPRLGRLKEQLYQAGATFASLSGSGSSMYGFFEMAPVLPDELGKMVIWKGKASSSVKTK